jgi:hypothetical protein
VDYFEFLSILNTKTAPTHAPIPTRSFANSISRMGRVMLYAAPSALGRLSEHPKAAIHEHLKSGHTFRRNVQDIDSSGRVSSLSQYGECLEGREETANHSVGTTGMVSAKDPRGHASTSRDHQRLSARRRCGNMAAGKMETRR